MKDFQPKRLINKSQMLGDFFLISEGIIFQLPILNIPLKTSGLSLNLCDYFGV